MKNRNLDQTETSTSNTPKKEYKKVEYLRTPGAYKVTINGMNDSADVEGYSGSPYIEFNLYTIDGKKTRARFWGVKDSDQERTADFKRKMLKEFMINAGVTDFSDMSSAFDSCIGKTINVCFTTREYIRTDRETGEPGIGTALDYKFSKKANENVKYDPKYNKTLTPDQRETYNTLLEEYNSSNSVSSASSEDDENLPF